MRRATPRFGLRQGVVVVRPLCPGQVLESRPQAWLERIHPALSVVRRTLAESIQR